MRIPGPSIGTRSAPLGIQRLCAECEDEVQRQPVEDEEKLLQAEIAGHDAPILTAKLAPPIARATSDGGQPLPPALRAHFDPRFGHDFARVRIHHGGAASRSARLINAQAYTMGTHIVFGEGRYAPATSAGRRLLAHELAHTVQQAAALPGPGPSAARALASSARGTRSPVPVIQRACKVTPPPEDLGCSTAIDLPARETSIPFQSDNSGITVPTRELARIAAAWDASGGISVLRLDGFAGCDGSAERNWYLSCKGALAVAAELQAGSPAMPASHIRIFAHGEIDQFSDNPMFNRRVIITSDNVPVPGPICPLGVSGPDEVDHYCAAYVPTDAPSCGVFPAPKITLTAERVARGGSPIWSIVRGGAMASIAGANTRASVDIQGDAASVNPGDVTVRVTDGTCTKTHALTVREPSEMTALTTQHAPTPTLVETLATYTVRDQFKKPMGADICVDETMTLCFATHPAKQVFRDLTTNPDGQVEDQLALSNPGGIPANMCRKFDQVMTAGGCGPLLHNTIVYQATGVTLNQNDSCTAPGTCP